MPAVKDRNPAVISSAMLLAAGLGTRMRPLTDTQPKPMIPVGGRPMIDTLLDKLDEAGVSRVVVNMHYLADRLEQHLSDRKKPAIIVSDERGGLLDSGGGVLKALPHLDETFMVLNADTVWLDGPRSNLRRLIEAWRPEKMDVLLLLAATTTAIGWGNRGDFAMEQDGRLRRPRMKEITPFAYAGVGIWKKSLFADMPPVFSLNRLFDAAIERESLYGLRLDGTWMHVGTPEAVEEANAAIAEHVL